MKIALLLLTGLFLTACLNTGSDEEVEATETIIITEELRRVVGLAFIAYAGDDLEASDEDVDETLKGCVTHELSRQPLLKDRYQLVWGPYVYRFDYAFLDDNMMFAVRDKQDPTHIIISIRGTNPHSVSDWLVEDFYVSKTVPWSYAENPNDYARISQATDIGLTALQSMPGAAELTIQAYLRQASLDKTVTKITVTGHSLAGALSPTFALWLKDTELEWNLSGNPIAINVIPIAGATPGNAVFAAYFDTRVGSNTARLHNKYDVVPQAWYLPTMHNIHKLYITDEYSIKPTILEELAFDAGILLAEDNDYLQIRQDQKSLGGVINPNAFDSHGNLTFAAQAGWQHHCGYYNLLDITDKMYEVSSSCKTFSTKHLCKKVPEQ